MTYTTYRRKILFGCTVPKVQMWKQAAGMVAGARNSELESSVKAHRRGAGEMDGPVIKSTSFSSRRTQVQFPAHRWWLSLDLHKALLYPEGHSAFLGLPQSMPLQIQYPISPRESEYFLFLSGQLLY